MPRFNINQIPIAIGMTEAGLRHVDVAEHLGVLRGTITNLTARYRVRGNVDDLSRSDRSRRQLKTATFRPPHSDRHIRTLHLRDRFLPAT